LIWFNPQSFIVLIGSCICLSNEKRTIIIKKNRRNFLKDKMTFSSRLIYVLKTPLRRWKNETDEMYFIEMSLSTRSKKTELEISCKKSWDEELEAIAAWREQNDPIWQGQDYISVVRNRFQHGEWCYLARRSNSKLFVGVLFAAANTTKVNPVRYQVDIPPDTVGILDVYTSSKFRSKGFYSQIFNAAINDFINKGYKKAWIWIMPHNITSLAVHNRLGLSHVFLKVTLRQRWGLRWHRIEKVDFTVEKLLRKLDNAI
jgi:GNAT superfamily N-acetyltransferase